MSSKLFCLPEVDGAPEVAVLPGVVMVMPKLRKIGYFVIKFMLAF